MEPFVAGWKGRADESGGTVAGMSAPGWGIVMTAREPGNLVLANVAYHLGLGAGEAHVYLDDPDDRAAETLAALPGVRLTLCDTDHWQRLARRRPEGQNRRQGLNATHAYRLADVDWLIHLDADEFLRPMRGVAAMHAELAAFPRGFGYVSVPPAERVMPRDAAQVGLFDGVFRRPARVPPRLHRALYGEAADFLDGGMCSHASGKAFTPTGFDYQIRIHRPRAGKTDPLPAHSALKAQAVELLHFDGLTPLHWLVKLLRYGEHAAEVQAGMNGPHRMRQVAALRDAGDIAAVRALYERVQVLAPAQKARLAALGLCDTAPFDPAPVIARVLEDVPDLSAARFDADLRRAHENSPNPRLAELVGRWPG
ncbi:glycosyltransferase family 2 protein [Aquicoccus sp.]|uniref:glycosyltransferase family 2 protein n=1 Tax=Aquicoccus sp. TaxID=2055851 RepID=UPI003567802A